jgi:Flp pilus assembly protein TadD
LKALELEPNQPFVLNYLGYSWIEKGRHLARAQKMIEDAVRQRPRDGYIVDSLGWVLYRLGDYEKAVPHLERAVELQPSDPVINDHLGDAYWKVGRNREARFQWKRAKSLDPTDEVLEVLEEKLESGLIEN